MHEHDVECQNIVENLNGYIDGELDSELCGQLEAHIQSCPKCKVVVNTLKKTIHLYQVDGEKTSLPEDARKRLYACLDLEDYVTKD
ncbi:zf-HC2 domain-containing protein [bacterium]|nr:zf-HC2 domain-containing protein [bacterium]